MMLFRLESMLKLKKPSSQRGGVIVITTPHHDSTRSIWVQVGRMWTNVRCWIFMMPVLYTYLDFTDYVSLAEAAGEGELPWEVVLLAWNKIID